MTLDMYRKAILVTISASCIALKTCLHVHLA